MPAIPVTPATVPSAPTVSATKTVPGDGTLTVNFTPPTNTGGAAILNYEYNIGAGFVAISPAIPSGVSFELTGLTNGTTYNITLRAVNSVGASAASIPVQATPRTVPTAPTITEVIPTSGTLTLVFTPPDDNGGAAITNYVYSVSTSETIDNYKYRSPVSTLSPLIVTGLTNGVIYYIKLRAINVVGQGAVYTHPSVCIPYTQALAPTAAATSSVIPGAKTLAIYFNVPTSDGGRAITNYQYSVATEVTANFTAWANRTDTPTESISSPIIITKGSDGLITSLSNGTTYYVKIRAVTAAGAGYPSAVFSGTPTAIPAAPVITCKAGNKAIIVSLSPVDSGGAPITGYTYSFNGGTYASVGTTTTSPITITKLVDGITDLTNGTSYSIQLKAINSVGVSAASSAVIVQPAGTPPTITVNAQEIVNTTTTISVPFTLGSNNSGLSNYLVEYSTDGGSTFKTAATTNSPLAITSVSNGVGDVALTPGVVYSIQLRTVNTATSSVSTLFSSSLASLPSIPVITSVASNYTDIVGATWKSPGVTITFTQPAEGGTPTYYQYSVDSLSPLDYPDNWLLVHNNITNRPAANKIVITGLVEGAEYLFRLRACNNAGPGEESLPVYGQARAQTGEEGLISNIIVDSNTATVKLSTDLLDTYSYSYSLNNSDFLAVSHYQLDGRVAFNIPNLVPGNVYILQVRAYDGAFDKYYTKPFEFLFGAPNRPEIVLVEQIFDELLVHVKQEHILAENITGYSYSLNGSAFSNMVPPTGTITIPNIPWMAATYNIVVRAFNLQGAGIDTRPFTYTVNPSVAYYEKPEILTVRQLDSSDAAEISYRAPRQKYQMVDILNYEYLGPDASEWYPATFHSTATNTFIIPYNTKKTEHSTGYGAYYYELTIRPVTLTGATTNSVGIRYKFDNWTESGPGTGEASPGTGALPQTPPPNIDAVTIFGDNLAVNFSLNYVYSYGEYAYLVPVYYGYELVLPGLSQTIYGLHDPVLQSSELEGFLIIEGLPKGEPFTLRLVSLNRVTAAKYILEDYTNLLWSSSWEENTHLVGSPAQPIIAQLFAQNQKLTIYFEESATLFGGDISAVGYYLYPVNNPYPNDDGVIIDPNDIVWVTQTDLTPIVITGLTNGTAYKVRAFLRTQYGDSAASKAAIATCTLSVSDLTLPSAPRSLTCEAYAGEYYQSSHDFKLTFNWVIPVDLGGDNRVVYYEYSFNNGTLTKLAGNILTFTKTGLTPNTSYSFKIRAYTLAGASGWTEITATTAAVGLSAPTITAVTRGSEQLTVHFDLPSGVLVGDVSDYLVTVHTDASLGGEVVYQDLSVTPIAGAFTITGLSYGVSYTIQLRLVPTLSNSVGLLSHPYTGGVPYKYPDPPELLTQSMSASGSPGAIEVTLHGDGKAADILSYKVYLTGGVYSNTEFVITSQYPTAYTLIAPISKYVTYSLRALIVTEAGTSSLSSPVYTTPNSIPPTPTITSVTMGSYVDGLSNTVPAAFIAFSIPAVPSEEIPTDYNYAIYNRDTLKFETFIPAAIDFVSKTITATEGFYWNNSILVITAINPTGTSSAPSERFYCGPSGHTAYPKITELRTTLSGLVAFRGYTGSESYSNWLNNYGYINYTSVSGYGQIENNAGYYQDKEYRTVSMSSLGYSPQQIAGYEPAPLGPFYLTASLGAEAGQSVPFYKYSQGPIIDEQNAAQKLVSIFHSFGTPYNHWASTYYAEPRTLTAYTNPKREAAQREGVMYSDGQYFSAILRYTPAVIGLRTGHRLENSTDLQYEVCVWRGTATQRSHTVFRSMDTFKTLGAKVPCGTANGPDALGYDGASYTEKAWLYSVSKEAGAENNYIDLTRRNGAEYFNVEGNTCGQLGLLVTDVWDQFLTFNSYLRNIGYSAWSKLNSNKVGGEFTGTEVDFDTSFIYNSFGEGETYSAVLRYNMAGEIGPESPVCTFTMPKLIYDSPPTKLITKVVGINRASNKITQRRRVEGVADYRVYTYIFPLSGVAAAPTKTTNYDSFGASYGALFEP